MIYKSRVSYHISIWCHNPMKIRGSKVLGNVGILPHHYTESQPSEDGGRKFLQNVGILTHHYALSQPSEDRGRKFL
jgi:hypothetical protein